MRLSNFVLVFSGIHCWDITVGFRAPVPFLPVPYWENLLNNGVALEMSSTAKNKKKTMYGEKSREFRRTVYAYDDWVKHRTDKRFFRNLATGFTSGVLINILKEVAAVTVIATFIMFWNAVVVAGYKDLTGVQNDALFSTLPLLSLPLTPFTLSSPALGLLLVFRTNSSYGRWDEARKFWGLNINHTRNLMRQATTWTSAEIEPNDAVRQEKLNTMARAVWSFARSLARHLSDPDTEEEFKAELLQKLRPAEAEAIIDAVHRPNRAMQFLAESVNDLPMHEMRRNEIDKSIIILEDTCGGSERLFSSPVPLFYTRHTARFLSAWLALLPFALYGTFSSSWNHWVMIPASAIVSLFMFGIEELAVQLEEPFSILPMEGFATKIGANAEEIASWHLDDESYFE